MTIPILPVGVGVDALVAITFDTAVNPSEAGIAGRKAMRQVAIRNYTATIGPDDAAAVQQIYLAVLGERYPVAFRDWTSYSYTDEVLAWTKTTDQTIAPLRRTYTAGGHTVIERILIPDETEVFTTIKINGFTPVSGVIVNIVDPGEIVINYALTDGDVVTASGHYFKAVCFADDLTATVHRGPGSDGNVLFSFSDVHLREILEAEYRALTA